MSAIIRKIRSQKSGMEPSSTGEGLAKPNRPAPPSTLGLRVVNPCLVDALIDIVFVHGLTGGRESTWTAKGANACWPELLLTNDLPEARVITYGYDADVVHFWSMASQNTVGDHSQKLLISLANLRDSTNTVGFMAITSAARLIPTLKSRRSLAFVAHSLGGIVCQDALLKSRGSADRYTQRILEHTEGILFIGTPHCGSGLAEWAVIGSKFLQCFRQINQGTLEILQQKSEVMARIRQDFHTMLRGLGQQQEKEIAIICFYEELPMRNFGEVVPKGSAILERYTAIGIHKNHIDMTKFSNNQDPDYRNVLSELQRFIQPDEQQPKGELPLAPSIRSEAQGQYQYGTRNERSLAEERDQVTKQEEENLHQPTKLVNTFSGTFHTNGGRIIQGNEFNSMGGSMTF
ncbi:MAG: hypothetical protein Q9164_004993 [Protoblastenia rupestris]